MENGQKYPVPLSSPLDISTGELLVDIENPMFSFNRQRYLGGRLQNSARWEHDGWFAGWYGHTFAFEGIGPLTETLVHTRDMSSIGFCYKQTETECWSDEGFEQWHTGYGKIQTNGDTVAIEGETCAGEVFTAVLDTYKDKIESFSCLGQELKPLYTIEDGIRHFSVKQVQENKGQFWVGKDIKLNGNRVPYSCDENGSHWGGILDWYDDKITSKVFEVKEAEILSALHAKVVCSKKTEVVYPFSVTYTINTPNYVEQLQEQIKQTEKDAQPTVDYANKTHMVTNEALNTLFDAFTVKSFITPKKSKTPLEYDLPPDVDADEAVRRLDEARCKEYKNTVQYVRWMGITATPEITATNYEDKCTVTIAFSEDRYVWLEYKDGVWSQTKGSKCRLETQGVVGKLSPSEMFNLIFVDEELFEWDLQRAGVGATSGIYSGIKYVFQNECGVISTNIGDIDTWEGCASLDDTQVFLKGDVVDCVTDRENILNVSFVPKGVFWKNELAPFNGGGGGELVFYIRDIRDEQEREIFRYDLNHCYMFVKQHWSNDVSVENYWWIDSTHVLELSKYYMTLYRKGVGVTPWMGDNWDIEYRVPRDRFLGVDDLKYGVTSAHNAVPFFYKLDEVSGQLRVQWANVLTLDLDAPVWNSRSFSVTMQPFGTALSTSAISMYDSRHTVEGLIAGSTISSTVAGNRFLMGIALARGLRQWTLNLNTGLVINGFGHVGLDGTLTGAAVPANVCGGSGFNAAVQSITNLPEEGSEVPPSGCYGSGSTVWFVYPEISDIVISINPSGVPITTPLNNNTASLYRNTSFMTMRLFNLGLQRRSLAQLFGDGTVNSGLGRVASRLTVQWYLMPQMAYVSFLNHSYGQYAYLYRNSTQEYVEGRLPGSRQEEVNVTFGRHANVMAFCQVIAGVTQILFQLLVAGLGTVLPTATGVAGSALNEKPRSDIGAMATVFALDNIAAGVAASVTTTGLQSALNSTLVGSWNLGMFYSISDKSQSHAGAGFVNHNFVGLCAAQSVTDLQIDGMQAGFFLGIADIITGAKRAAGWLLRLTADGIENGSNGLISNTFGIGIGFFSAGITQLAALIVMALQLVTVGLLRSASRFIEIAADLQERLSDMIDSGKGFVAGDISKKSLEIEGTHFYGQKPMSFFFPAFGVDVVQYTNEKVRAAYILHEAQIEGKWATAGAESWQEPPYFDEGSDEADFGTQQMPSAPVTTVTIRDRDYTPASGDSPHTGFPVEDGYIRVYTGTTTIRLRATVVQQHMVINEMIQWADIGGPGHIYGTTTGPNIEVRGLEESAVTVITASYPSLTGETVTDTVRIIANRERNTGGVGGASIGLRGTASRGVPALAAEFTLIQAADEPGEVPPVPPQAAAASEVGNFQMGHSGSLGNMPINTPWIEAMSGELKIVNVACQGAATRVSAPPRTAVVEGVTQFLPSSPFKDERIGVSGPVFPHPPLHDYVIAAGWDLGVTAIGGEIVSVSVDDTKIIDGPPSNIVVQGLSFCGVASSYTAIEVLNNYDHDYLRPVAVTPTAIGLNINQVNCIQDGKYYHAFDGQSNRFTKWTGNAGMDKSVLWQQWLFQANDHFKRSNIYPPSQFLGAFDGPPNHAVSAYDQVVNQVQSLTAQVGIEQDVPGEQRNLQRFSVPVHFETLSTLPAMVRTLQPYMLQAVEGITSLTTEIRNTQAGYKAPSSVDFNIYDRRFRDTEEYVSIIEGSHGILTLRDIAPTAGLMFIGPTTREAFYYSPATKMFYSFDGNSLGISVLDIAYRFKDIQKGRWDFVNQEVVFKALLAHSDSVDLATRDMRDREIVLRLNNPVLGELYPPPPTIYTEESGFKIYSMAGGITYQGPKRFAVNRPVITEAMYDGIISNFGNWQRLSRKSFFPERVYHKPLKGWLHNPFKVATAMLGIDEETEMRFEWIITFTWTPQMEAIFAANQFVVAMLQGETAVQGNRLLSDVTRVFLQRSLFNNGYYTLTWQSNNGAGNRERLFVWSDGLMALEGLAIEAKVITKKKTQALTQQLDIVAKEEM